MDTAIEELEYNQQFVVESLSPFCQIQDELLDLFFTHINTIFPIVNEHNFLKVYHKQKVGNSPISPECFLLLLAISFAAFAVSFVRDSDNLVSDANTS
jgi:hypothetical protein